MRYTELWTH